jgi:asparagine synthase (glutamine-hydrolysing)
MSIQAGVWNRDGEPVRRDALATISLATAEYGPDGEAMHIDGNLGMLYRPFHTVPESRLENQPYVFGAGKVITWDGRLDNRDELIFQLASSLRGGRSDLAIVSAAFERWNTGCFSRLVGDWALSVWNPTENELILARDYMGIRPLFYHHSPTRIVWSSLLEPLTQDCDRLSISDEYVAGYLVFHPDAHLTPYAEILCVPPGSYVRMTVADSSAHRYWVFNPNLKIRHSKDEDYEEEFRRLFRQAVRRRLRAESPILAGLSGGFDSTSIVCMADQLCASGDCASKVDTFSYYDPAEPDDDFFYFSKVEQRRGRIGHHAELCSTGDTFFFQPNHPPVVPGFGEREELRRARAQVVQRGAYRVLLSGMGGDELLGQAFDPRIQIADSLVRLQLNEFVKHIFGWSLAMRVPALHLLIESVALLIPGSLRRFAAPSRPLHKWVKPAFAGRHRLGRPVMTAAEGSIFWRPSTRDAYQTLANLSRQITHLRPLVVERRYPFLDQSLVEFLTSIPTEQLIRPGQRRSLLRRALGNLLPPEVLARRTKASSGRCVTLSVQKHWSFLSQILRSPQGPGLDCIDHDELLNTLKQIKDGALPDGFFHAMRAVSLVLWTRHMYDRQPAAGYPSVFNKLAHEHASVSG